MDSIFRTLGSARPFLKSGELSASGCIAYQKLLYILTELNRIGVITEDADECEKEISQILKLGI